MSEVTVNTLAKMVGTPVEKLLEQLAEAGMTFSGPDQVVTSTEKMKLLGFLRRTHGKADKPAVEASPKQITLNRRKQEELTVSAGKARTTVTVEVRQKRTYVKRDQVETPVNNEREDALRKLEESKSRNQAEVAALDEVDRKRREEETARREAEEAARKSREKVEVVEAVVEEVPTPTLTPAKPVVAPVAEKSTHKQAPSPEPRRRETARENLRDAKPAHKKTQHRGTHAMPAEIDENDAANRFSAQLHLSDAERARRGAGKRKTRTKPIEASRQASGQHGFARPTAPMQREVAIGESISVADLAQKLALKGGEVVKALFKMGTMVTINQVIDHDTAVLVVEELGHTAVTATENDAESALIAHGEEEQGHKESRPPVVTIMGHVDHGKTSLLDYIRRTKVATGEAGGITQHIGAYHVETPKGTISFLDTPGHAAFSSMRARGAKLTDIVILVVAADDGVMPQTAEAVQHARAAGVPLIVAMNKMDKPDANPDNIKQGLVKLEVVPEDWGGDTQFVPVSAKTGLGVDALLDAILVQSEVMELSAVRDGRAGGVVIESSLDKGRGPVATVLVQQGTLKKGDYLVCGVQYGRVRALFDESGHQVDEAGPSIPVQLLGLSGVPDSGDDFTVVEDERLAKDVAQQRDAKRRESRLVSQAGNRMEDIMAQMGQGAGQLSLALVVKADVHGSVQALRESLVGLSNDQIRINVISSGVGGITESDAQLAAASKAVIIGFNVRADASARKVIEANGLDLRYFSIIYDVIDQVKQVASGLLGKEIREEIIGTAQVMQVFRHSKFGSIAGSQVLEGVIRRGKPIRVLRNNVVIFEGELDSLRRFSENVDEVKVGTECGIGVKGYDQVKAGDQIECFERIEIQRTL
ncbi:MAG TPA: translation initiation factor IF-2 [Xanthomonadaceae bacterium]|jgi:translation initiation factor IF-2|nr:translation initiation factor IF-2 [Xanthomonadaceae bacterium]